MFAKVKSMTTRTPTQKVIQWLRNLSKENPSLTSEISLLIAYWQEPDFQFQKQVQSTIPTGFTEWIGEVSLTSEYDTESGKIPCGVSSAMNIVLQQETPLAIHYHFSYMWDGLLIAHTITANLDIKALLDAAEQTDSYKNKATYTIHLLTSSYAAKIAKYVFLEHRQATRNVKA